MLGNGHGDASDIRLLEGILAYKPCINLAGDGDHGHRVHVSVGYSRDQVGGAWPRGGYADAYFSGSSGVAVGHVSGSLLVAYQDMLESGVVDDIVEGQQHTAGKAEDYIYPFSLQALYYRLTSSHLSHLFSPPPTASTC